MNIFQLGADQLKTTHDEVASLQSVDIDARVAVAIETLEEIQLSQFYALCEVVGESPQMTDFYASALQRVQIMDAVSDQNEARDQEKENLESFFTLFDPEHPVYTSYVGRLAIREPSEAYTSFISQFTASGEEIVTPPVDTEDDETPGDPIDAATAQPSQGTEVPAPAESTSEAGSLNEERIRELAKTISLSKREVEMLKIILTSAPDGDFRASHFDFTPALGDTDYKGPFIVVSRKLKDADILIHNGKARGGSKNRVNVSRVAELGLFVTEESEATPAATTPASTPERARSPKEPESPRRMNSQNKLTQTGIIIGGSRTSYEPYEKEIITILGNSPRKALLSAGNIAGKLGISEEKATTALTTLQTKLPEGWIAKSRTDSGSMWRVGSGIRIKG